MVAHADDYSWFEQQYPDLMEAYCLTLVRGLTPEETLNRFGAGLDRTFVTGVNSLFEPSYQACDRYGGDRLLLGVADLGGWSLAVEPNGYLGVTEGLVERVSLGTRLVSHFRNVNAVDYFYLVDDGDVKLTFEPLFAHHRSGSDPESYVGLMRAVGFHVDEGDEEYEGHTEATFALAEELTGVRLTPDVLDNAVFCYSTAPAPH
jgi:Family of unknown function (DUF6461)